MNTSEASRSCGVDGCEAPVSDWILCAAHYQIRVDMGTLPRHIQETPERRFWSKVIKSGGCWEWAAFRDHKGYGKFTSWPSGEQYAHRISYIIHAGSIPEGMLVDHICHNAGCVNPEHLRLATPKQNVENHSGVSSVNTSGVRGVHWRADAGRWQGLVRHEGKRHHVGYFDTIEQAESAVLAKRNELHTFNDLDRIRA